MNVIIIIVSLIVKCFPVFLREKGKVGSRDE